MKVVSQLLPWLALLEPWFHKQVNVGTDLEAMGSLNYQWGFLSSVHDTFRGAHSILPFKPELWRVHSQQRHCRGRQPVLPVQRRGVNAGVVHRHLYAELAQGPWLRQRHVLLS